MTSTVENRIVLIRHGQTDWSRDSRHTGRTDIALNQQGQHEASLVAPTLDEWSFAAVFSSPLVRAKETAALAGFDAHIVLLEDLMEWDYGVHEGRTNAEIQADHPGWSKWSDPLEGGELAEQVGVRADRAIETLEIARAAGDVLVFAHGHLLAILIARWLGFGATEGRRFVLDTATVSVLGQKRDDRVLRLFNHGCGHSITPTPAPL